MTSKFRNPTLMIPILLFCLLPIIACSQYKYLVFTEKCYQSLVSDLNLQDRQCIKLTISKILGYTLVVGGAVVKFPQVIKILIHKSVYGISFYGILLQALTNWVTIVYSWYRGNPFNIYGQNVFLMFQNILIMILSIIFARNVPKNIPIPDKNIITRYCILLASFFLFMTLTNNHEIWPSIFIIYSMFLQILLFSMARLTQIYHIYRQKSTGNLALITWLLILCGNFARLFTVLVQISQDYVYIFSTINTTILNSTVVTQFIIYWHRVPKKQEIQKKQV